MADVIEYVKVTDEKVALTTTSTVEIDRTELEARRAFWTDEIVRLDTDYANQRAAAVKALAEVEAALKSITPVETVKEVVSK